MIRYNEIQLETFTALLNLIINNGDNWILVSDPGPNYVFLKIEIVHVKQSRKYVHRKKEAVKSCVTNTEFIRKPGYFMLRPYEVGRGTWAIHSTKVLSDTLCIFAVYFKEV